MSINPSKTQNNIIKQYSFRSIFAENIGFSPAYVGYPVKADIADVIKFGEPVVYDGAVVAGGILTGGFAKPLRAAYDSVNDKFTPNGQLLGISLTANGIGNNNSGEIRVATLGSIITSFIDLESVSDTQSNPFTLKDLVSLPEVEGSLLPANQASGDLIFNLVGVSPVDLS